MLVSCKRHLLTAFRSFFIHIIFRFYAPYRRLVDLSFEWGRGDAPRGTLKLLREGKLIEDPILDDEEKNKSDDKASDKHTSRLTMVLGGIAMCGFGFYLGRLQPRSQS